MKISVPQTSVACPACQAVFTQAAGSRSKRVQCPRCRQIVSLEPEVAAAPSGKPELEARIKLLEARIHSLEEMLTQLAANALPRAPFRWAARTEAATFSEPDAALLRENLGKVPPYEIAIQAPPANSRAAWLRSAFEDAHWTVKERAPGALTIPKNSLAMATSLPVSPAISAAYLALHASGFSLLPLFTPQGDEHLIVA